MVRVQGVGATMPKPTPSLLPCCGISRQQGMPRQQKEAHPEWARRLVAAYLLPWASPRTATRRDRWGEKPSESGLHELRVCCRCRCCRSFPPSGEEETGYEPSSCPISKEQHPLTARTLRAKIGGEQTCYVQRTRSLLRLGVTMLVDARTRVGCALLPEDLSHSADWGVPGGDSADPVAAPAH